MRYLPRRFEPPNACGREVCSDPELSRWAEHKWALPPYQFREENLVLDRRGFLRIASVAERGRLLHFPDYYLEAATPSALRKYDTQKEFSTKASLLGNSMDVWIVALVAGQALADWGYLTRPPTMDEIRQDDVEKLHLREESAASDFRPLSRSLSEKELMVWWIMSHCDHTGSDVRLSSGQLMRPSRVPRQGMDTRWWHWRDQLSFEFKDKSSHINEKELRAAFTELRRRARCKRHLGSRYLHLLDSAVSLGVLTKHRSSSHRLQRVLRRAAATELASSIRPIYSFVRSALNPADRASRRRFSKKTWPKAK